MKKNTFLLALLALLLVVCVSVGPALAYFSTFTRASGTATLSLEHHTWIKEPDFDEEFKQIQIKNYGKSPCYVRVAAFAPDGITLALAAGDTSGWSKDGDYWVYGSVLQPGDTANDLVLVLGNLPVLPSPSAAPDINQVESFNIPVGYEATIAVYDPDTEAYKPADWGLKFDLIGD